MRTAISLFIGYLVAAAMTEHVSMDVTLTHWDNLWTYFWIIFGPLVVLLTIAFAIIIFTAVVKMFTE